MVFLMVILSIAALCNCSPISRIDSNIFKEAEYDVTLEKAPGKKMSYFVKQDEMPIYEKQFAKIKELGEDIGCKINGNCATSKRASISSLTKKSSMFDDNAQNQDEAQFQDQLNMNAMGGPAGAEGGAGLMGGEDMTSMMGAGSSPPASKFSQQKNPAAFGQQPQMDIKLSANELSAVSAGYGHFSNPMGPQQGGGPSAEPAMGPPNPQQMIGNDGMMKLRGEQNSLTIDAAIQDKMNFMNKANGPALTGPPQPEMPGMGGASMNDPLSGPSAPSAPSAAHHTPEAKDDMPGGVTENDLMKAEDIQPNEMKGITNFLKDSNHMDKPASEQSISDAPSEDGAPGKTNVDFGGQQANIENEGGEGEKDTPDPSNGGPAGPMTPGGPEVPTLNNLGLGMGAAEMGPPGAPPSLKFVQDNTRQMIQQNSDYKVPNSALSNLWNSYMSSSQGVLGEKDPSSNSRQAISRPAKKLHRRSNQGSRRHQ